MPSPPHETSNVLSSSGTRLIRYSPVDESRVYPATMMSKVVPLSNVLSASALPPSVVMPLVEPKSIVIEPDLPNEVS